MAIEIIDENLPPLRLTREQHDSLFHEYQQNMMFYAGAPIDFESWARRKIGDQVSIRKVIG
jgi:hypothetical protein